MANGRNEIVQSVDGKVGRVLKELESLKQRRVDLLNEVSEIDGRLEKSIEILGRSVSTSESKPAKVARRRKKSPSKGSSKQQGATAKRAKRGSIKNAIIEALGSSRKPVTAAEVTDLVLKAGFKTNSDNFRQVVNTTLRRGEGSSFVKHKDGSSVRWSKA